MKYYPFFLLATTSLVFAMQAPTPASPTRKAVEIHYSDHHFSPQEVLVPAGQAIVLRVINESQERIEFESFKLHFEVVVSGGKTAVIRLPKLKPGKYDFFDDFNDDVPDGQILAR